MDEKRTFKIVNEFPPNIKEIEKYLDLTGAKPVFAWGDVIFNPHKAELRPDLLVHEEIHCKQMGNDPEGWWKKYLTDADFRLSQELDAYAVQYQYVKGLGVTAKKLDWFLDQLATMLSSPMYGNVVTHAQAKTAIRKTYKRIVNTVL